MNSMDVNKAVAAVLVAGIAFMVTGFIANGLVVTENPAKPAIKIEIAATNAPAAAAPEGPGPILALLASADVQAGQTEVTHVCAACHTYNEGGPTLVGPNLYGVVGRKQASMPGFSYSDAFKGKMTGTWTYAALNTWLYAPMKDVPGTRMAFVGIPSDKQRADVIAFLRTLSKSPEPLPTAAEIAAEAPKQAAAAAPAAAGAAAPAAAGAAPAGPDFGMLVAKADASKGSTTVHGICAACHTLNKGGPTLVGPNLWDVVGRKQASEPGFAYSDPFKAKMKGTWTYDELNTWLTAPMKEVPGTHMAFAGLSSEQQRADVVAYLRTLADTPAPLPK
jgi:cytochrome c